MTTARLRAVVVGGLAVVTGVVSAAPAVAAPPTITFLSPGSAEKVPASAVTVSARVEAEHVLVDSITLTVEQLDSDRPDITASTPAGDSPQQTVQFRVELPYNGEYKATVTATGAPVKQAIDPVKETSSASRKFFVAAPPAKPTDVKTELDPASRVVTVTWKANAEPDMLFYVVQRAAGASTDFMPVSGKIAHPETKFADTSTAAAGGEYRYQVVAVRRGVNKDEGVNSDPSALSPASTATVPAPPGGATVAGTTGTGTPGVGATPGSTLPAGSPGALTTSGTVDLNGFTAVQNAARRTPRTVPPPDHGFQSTLPFAPRPGAEEPEEEGELGEVAADGSQFRELGATEEGADRQRTLAFFAGGLLATVLLLHLLWVRSEVKRVPLEAVTPEGPGPGDGWSVPPAHGSVPGRTQASGEPPGDLGEWFVPGRLGADDAAVTASHGSGRRHKVLSGP